MTRGPALLAAFLAALTLGAVVSASTAKESLAQTGVPNIAERGPDNRSLAASVGEEPFIRYPGPVLIESNPPLDIVNDEFRSSTLDPNWRFLNGTPTQWSVGGSPGAFRITTEDGDLFSDFNDAKGVLIRKIPEIPFEIRTKVTFNPTVNGQQAGLIQFFDQDTYLKLVRIRNSDRSPTNPNFIEMTYEVNGVARELNIVPTNATTVFLRFKRDAGFTLGQWSTDGFDWRLVAGFADIVIPDSKVGLYAVSGAGHPGPGAEAVFDYFRVDDIRGAAYDKYGVQSPSVLFDDDGTYRMWFTGQGDGDLNALNRIGLATSGDGITWQKVSSTPVFTGETAPNRDRGVSDATVIKDSGTYKMWFTGYVLSGTERAGDIYYATSSNGINWQRENRAGGVTNPVITVGAPGSWDDLEVRAGRVIKDGAVYRMWYSGRNHAGQTAIGLAESLDGIDWKKSVANPLIGEASSPRGIVADGPNLRMYYTSNGRIMTAISPNGVGWAPAGNPVLSPSDDSGWDIERVRDPWAIQEGSVVRLWYTGGSIPRIGRASSPLVPVQTIFAPVVSFGKALLTP